MTRKEMSDQVKYWLGLQDISGFDETGLILNQLYWGTIDLLARTKCVVRCVHLNVSAGEDTYILDHSLLALKDVEDGHRRRARRDETSSCEPLFTLIGADVLRVSPTPSASGTLDVWAVMRPTQMDSDDDSVAQESFGAIPDEFQDAIVTYALWKCSDYADDATGQQGERYRMLYEGQDGRGGRLAQIRVAVNRRAPRAPRRRVTIPASPARGTFVG